MTGVQLAVGRGVEVEPLDLDAHLVVPDHGIRVEDLRGLRQDPGRPDDPVQAHG